MGIVYDFFTKIKALVSKKDVEFTISNAEILFRKNLVANRFLLWTYPVFAIATVAMSYELIEWIYAVTAGDPSSGVAFLGSQGDIWDAQKDMLMDTLGAIFSATIFLLFVRRGK
jgi:putative membrane protein